MTSARLTTEQTSSNQKRNAILSALVLSAAFGLFLVLSVIEDITVGKSLIYTDNILLGVLLLTGLISLALIRMSRLQTAVIFLCLVVAIAPLGFVATTAELGLAIGVVTAATIAFISLSSLPLRLAGRMIVLGAVGGVAMILVDLYWPFPRLEPGPLVASFQPIILTAILLGTGFAVLRQFPSYTLRTKFIITLVATSLLSTGVVVNLSNQLARATLSKQAGAGLKDLADVQAQVVADFLHNEINSLVPLSIAVQNSVATANSKYSADPATIAEIDSLDQQWRAADAADNNADSLVATVLNHDVARTLHEYQIQFPSDVEMFVTDRYGANIAATNRTSDYYQADEAWWQAAYNNGEGAVYIGQPDYDASAHAYSVNIAIPVREPLTQQVIGVLRTTVDFKGVFDRLSATTVVGSSDLLLPDGTFIEHNTGEPMAAPELVKLIQESTENSFITRQEGEESIVSFTPVSLKESNAGTSHSSIAAINKLGWVVIAHRSVDEALAAATTQERSNLVFALIVSGLVVLVGLVAAQQLSGPITRLTGVAEKVRSGDLYAQARIESQDEIGTLASTFNSMTAQLRETLAGMELRVADRTRALALSAELSRRLSTLLDQSQLVHEVVEQLRATFNYYHVHMYLLDEAQQNLVMVGGTGEAGRIMLDQGHQIPKGRGLVGRAADSNLPVLVPDVVKDPKWLPNPLLPETKAEVAVPIAIGDRVLGVLDVQHNVVGGLKHEDADLIQSIANQVAIALQNVRAYEQARRQAGRGEMINTISQRIQNTTDVESALQIAAREVGRALGSRSRVTLRLKPESGQKNS